MIDCWTEEEGPCIHHRSLFDTEPPPAIRCAPTEPCPPSFACDDAAPTPLVTRKETVERVDVGCARAGELLFLGGVVQLPKPTRAELVLSAQQWSKAIADHLVDWNALDSRAKGMMERLDAALAELAAL
jgi:hypothetical protein